MNLRLSTRLSGVFAVSKPQGCSSAHALNELKRRLAVEKMGHGGTLDPLATGVLVVAVGTGCKLLSQFLNGLKRYMVTGKLGAATDSYDSEGKVVREAPFEHITPEALAGALAKYNTTFMQVPPPFSAKKVDGVRAYKLARTGQPVQLAPCSVTISELSLVAFSPPFFTLEFACSSGTYVRSLVHDIGRDLQSAAHVTALSRTQHGLFSLSEALPRERWIAEEVAAKIEATRAKCPGIFAPNSALTS